MTARVSTQRYVSVAALLLSASLVVSAQTKIEPPDTKYSLQDDVKLGQEAAAQAKKELPMLQDERVDAYVEGIGQRLAAAIPPEFQHPEFTYTFDVVNQKYGSAIALQSDGVTAAGVHGTGAGMGWSEVGPF